MFMFDFERTISTFERREWKNGHLSYMCCNFAKLPSSASIKCLKAEPTPYQPGNITRLCDHENTHGIARRPEISVMVLRAAGREPIFKLETSLIGLASKK